MARTRYNGNSIYHWINNKYMAEIAFSQGFRDIDCVGEGRLTPLAKLTISNTSDETWETGFQYAAWLIEKGADLHHKLPCSHPQEPPLVHSIAHRLMAWAGELVPGGTVHAASLLPFFKSLSRAARGDCCTCGCCGDQGGCSPVLIFLRHLFKAACTKHGWDQADCVRNLKVYFEPYEVITAMIATPLIRLLAFDALELRHTCCDEFIRKDSVSCMDDFEELRDEDAVLLERLEQLVNELDSRFEQSDLSIFAFFEVEGLQHLRQAADEVSGSCLTEEESDGIQRLGVKLMCDPVAANMGNTNAQKPRRERTTLEEWSLADCSYDYERIKRGLFPELKV